MKISVNEGKKNQLKMYKSVNMELLGANGNLSVHHQLSPVIRNGSPANRNHLFHSVCVA